MNTPPIPHRSHTHTPPVIAGLTPLSTVDYPGALAAVLFCQGCTWRCPYCHNAALQPMATPGEREWGEVVGWLEGRRGLLDAVVFSGGEPTLQAGLGAAMAAVAAMGFQVGLHTSGMAPGALEAVVGACDWVGLDIKAPRAGYDRITGRQGSGEAAWASLAVVKAGGVDFEVRTTWHPALLDEAGLRELVRELAAAGVGHWVLQGFRPQGCGDAQLAATGATAPTPELMETLGAEAPGMTMTVRT